MKKLTLLFSALLFTVLSFSQGVDFISKEDFKKKNTGITVVEFWANWNKGNQYQDLAELKDCKAYRVCIESNMELATKYKIISVPTIIVFNNGEERYRYEANVSFQLQTKPANIQEKIEEILMERFR